MESRVLPAPEISAILAAKFVCVKVDCDNPGPAGQMMSQVKGSTLPFYIYVTPDGKFITGTSGFRAADAFKADLEGVLKNDLLRLPPELEKKLARIAEQAAKDFEAKKTAAVIKAAKDAEAIKGSSDSKDKVLGLLAQILEGGRQKLKEAADLCRDGKADEAVAITAALAKDFKGTELEKATAAANKAADRFKSAAKESEPNGKGAKRLFELIVKECKDAPAFVELAEARLKE